MISALLTMHATWNSAALPLISFENRITSLWELSDDCRAYIRKYIARDTAILLLNLWEICMNKDGNYSIWNFMDLIVSSASLKFTLVSSGSSKSSSLWTLDRKRERKTIAELIQVELTFCIFSRRITCCCHVESSRFPKEEASRVL